MFPNEEARSSVIPTLFLHSLGTDQNLWRHQLATLETERHPLQAINSLGHGGRELTGEVSLATWVEDIESHLDPTQLYYLVGLSMGGIQALVYAAHNPDQIRGVVIANSFASLPPEVARERVSTAKEKISSKGIEAYASLYLEETLTTQIHEDDYQFLFNAIARMSPEAYLASAKTTFNADVRHLLPKVRCPVLVLTGAQDEKVPLARTEEILAGLDDASHIVIQNAGHLSCIENPQGFNSAITKFIESVEEATLIASPVGGDL
ncbi:alpha/beta hydrolase [Auritidibacter ignavus]|uniref:alpha/beta fold hydrolase n=1 Tax=Auritidibacter ignavus TaxID=678932 RepID=UPI002FE691E1